MLGIRDKLIPSNTRSMFITPFGQLMVTLGGAKDTHALVSTCYVNMIRTKLIQLNF